MPTSVTDCENETPTHLYFQPTQRGWYVFACQRDVLASTALKLNQKAFCKSSVKTREVTCEECQKSFGFAEVRRSEIELEIENLDSEITSLQTDIDSIYRLKSDALWAKLDNDAKNILLNEGVKSKRRQIIALEKTKVNLRELSKTL